MLNLANNQITIGVEGAAALANCPFLTNLAELNLADNRLDEPALAALALSLRTRGLKSLNLANNRLGVRANGEFMGGADALRELGSSPALADLSLLNLAQNYIDDEGVNALLDSPYLVELSSLNLASNGISDVGLATVANCKNLTNLASLNLSGNWIGRDGVLGVSALTASPYLANLKQLNLASNSIGHEAALTLARSTQFDRIVSLDLGGNPFGENAWQALQQTFGNRIKR
jgi:Ran GTPase-activating protein (RanGAP) involved in mRNA processing and transport